ncbi:MAG: M15 family metallopeptidase [Saprospiraceae bacterium]
MKIINYFLLFGLLLFTACQADQNTGNSTPIALKTDLKTKPVDTEATKQASEKIDTINSMETPHASFTPDYIMGKFTPKEHADFVAIDQAHSSRAGMYLRKDAYEAFKKMSAAAKAAGINFKIISATRNFASQKGIWEGKWTGKRLLSDGQNAAKAIPDPATRALKILEYSSMPGTSRHHWGTDIDINNLNNSYFEKGKGLKEYNWLVANAPSYGFCQPYTPKGEAREHGYNEEKWHWSYQPVASQLTTEAKRILQDKDIKGFQGSDTAEKIGVIEKYVLGISQDCL